MKSISAEQFKKLYGESAASSFSIRKEEPKFGSDFFSGMSDTLGSVGKGFTEDVPESAQRAGQSFSRAVQSGDPRDVLSAGLSVPAEAAKAGFGIVGRAMAPVAEAAERSYQESPFLQGFGETLRGWLEKPLAEYLKFKKDNPQDAEDIENALTLGSLYIGAGAGQEAKGALSTVSKTTERAIVNPVKAGLESTAGVLDDAVSGVKSILPSQRSVGGLIQKGKELGERVPRLIQRGREGIENSASRAERIRSATPEVQKAITSGVDERIINTVSEADDATLKGYREMIDLADKSGTKLKSPQRPEIVAGRVAGDQYKVINNAKKEIGKQIGDVVDNLSDTIRVPAMENLVELNNILRGQGVKISVNGRKIKLNFSTTKFTPAERARIKELYTLATEGGSRLTPKQVYGKDQLFSKLQRETRMEGLGDILIDIGNGQKKSIFGVFRDVFSNTLESYAPQIKNLNKEYRKYVTMLDDIENSIVKSGKFETTGKIDPAEFAQTNLRRILSDAQSAADYRAILEQMDEMARQLGYTGARADDLITFAAELRNIFPDTIPANSFSGGIRTGIKPNIIDIAEKVIKAGEPGLIDQQRALVRLIDSMLSKNEQIKIKPKETLPTTK